MKTITIDQVPLFQALPAEELRFLKKAFRRTEIAAGHILFQEGKQGDQFFVILSGELEVFKALEGTGESIISLRGPGDFVGEMSMLMRDGLRTASVRARTNVEVLGLSHTDLDSLLARRPSLAFEMVRELSLRLRDANNAQIHDLEEKNRQLAVAYKDLQAAQAQIVEKEKLEHELDMARDIQTSILPRELPKLAGFDFGARMIPARAVGGDFYDFIPLDNDRVGIAIGDVSDKGVPAAIFMALFSSLLRVEASRNARPAAVLREINHHLLGMNETGMFVTVIYGILHKVSGKFEYARAGHEVPLWFTNKGECVSVPWNKGQPLCIFPAPEIDEQSVSIYPGQTLFLYTDGVVDARGLHDERYSLERLSRTISQSVHVSGEELCAQVVVDIEGFQQDGVQFDDMTMLAIHSEGAGPVN
jgi:sigma-B regulation protein RsbU (phosphoserine phosphatase)